MTRRVVALCAMLCVAFSPTTYAADSSDRSIAVTVVPFVAHGAEQTAWLGKGVADLLMRHLAESGSLIVLDRDQLQTFLEEMELADSGFVNQSDALRVAAVARVDRVIYGNYTLKGDLLALELLAVDLESQAVILRARARGSIGELHRLVSDLAGAFLEGNDVPFDPAALATAPVHSLPATERFYRGIDHYDRGEYELAFGEFYLAGERDENYLEARLWMGKMLEALGQSALAITAYRDLYERAPRRVEVLDARMFAARLLEEVDVELALATYRPLVELSPQTPHSLEAALRAGSLLYEKGEFRQALKTLGRVDAFRARIERSRPADARGRSLEEIPRSVRHVTKIRQSRFFRWSRALGLYREAIVTMASAYGRLARTTPLAELPPAPRGVLLVDPKSPTIAEARFGKTRPLFHEQRLFDDWRELFYAVVIPGGYVATGVDMEVRGKVLRVSSENSFAMRVLPFPLPKEYTNAWLGAIYGQTPTATRLKKRVPFYGNDREVLTLQLINGRSRINDWKLHLRLRPEPTDSSRAGLEVDADAPEDSDVEGKRVGSLRLEREAFAGISRPSYRYFYEPRHMLTLANNDKAGLHVITVRGELGGEHTDLWWSRSTDATRWTRPVPLTTNSSSDDFDPRLVRAEDGSLRLFWLSNRRGLGWEIWTSRYAATDDKWDQASRVPLDSFVRTGLESSPGELATALLPYAVTQDRRGRWVLVYFSKQAKRLVVLLSSDAKDWRIASQIPAGSAAFNPAIIEDRSGRYRLAAMDREAKLVLWSSNDLQRWRQRRFVLNDYRFPELASTHPLTLFSEAPDRLLLLVSDATFGLQYARFHPDTDAPEVDLVKDAGLEAYAATSLGQGSYLVALRHNDEIRFQQYRAFHAPANGDNPRRSRIYVESTQDTEGRRWQRIFARERWILPDVTTVGAARNGRVWWGIESGVMSLRNGDFFFSDVALGFFHHYVTDIVPCGARTAFTSSTLDAPVLGFAERAGGGSRPFAVRSENLSKLRGGITAVTCTADDTLYVGTDNGDVVGRNSGKVIMRQHLADESVTAIAYDESTDTLWVGTAAGHLYRSGSRLGRVDLPSTATGPIHALAVDRTGQLWAAAGDTGLHRRSGGAWSHIGPGSRRLPYTTIGSIRADAEEGIWMIPHPRIRSVGLAYLRRDDTVIFNPPDRRLEAPTGLSIGRDGDIWLGSAFHGVYKLERGSL